MKRFNVGLLFVLIAAFLMLHTMAEASQNKSTGNEVDPDEICPCPRNWDPKCGSDGVTYGNECLFRCAVKNKAAHGVKLRKLKNDECDE